MPQMKGAGVTMVSILGWPYYAGILVVGIVITFNVAFGGMKGITIVQAMQYWAKLFAISAPIFVLMAIYGAYHTKLDENGSNLKGAPKLEKPAELKFKGQKDAPVNAVSFSAAGETTMVFPKGATIGKVSTARKPEPGEDPAPLGEAIHLNADESGERRAPASGLIDALTAIQDGKPASIPEGVALTSRPFVVTKGELAVMKDGKPVKTAPKIEFVEPATATLSAGSFVPNAPNNKKWLEPFGTLTGKYNHPLLYTYSLIIALVCGTAGLPHILVRFYTNPDGRSAKRTTMLVMIMLGCFYVFTPCGERWAARFCPRSMLTTRQTASSSSCRWRWTTSFWA